MREKRLSVWVASGPSAAPNCRHWRNVLQPPHHVQVQAAGQEDIGAVLDRGAFGGAGHVVDL
jgi:hypothetical protein